MACPISASKLIKNWDHHFHPFSGTYTQEILLTNSKLEVKCPVALKTSQKIKAFIVGFSFAILTAPLLIFSPLIGYSAFTIYTARAKARLLKAAEKQPDQTSAIATAKARSMAIAERRAELMREKLALIDECPDEESKALTATPQTSKIADAGADMQSAAIDAPRTIRQQIDNIDNELNLLTQDLLALAQITKSEEPEPLDKLKTAIFDEMAKTAAAKLKEEQEIAALKAKKEAQKQELERQRQLKAAKERAEKELARRKAQDEAFKVESIIDDFCIFLEQMQTKHGIGARDFAECAHRAARELPRLPIPDDQTALTPLAANQVTGVSLLNNTGTTCWLNSVLNFLANSTLGDELCGARVEGEENRRIQSLLRKILISLRSGQQGCAVHRQLLSDFLLAIAPLMPEASLPIPGNYDCWEQQEAREIVTKLAVAFNYPTVRMLDPAHTYAQENCTQLTTLYRPVGNEGEASFFKGPSTANPDPFLQVRCLESTLAEGYILDPNQLIKGSEIVEFRPDLQLIDGTLIPADAPNMNMIKAQFLTHAPQKMRLSIDRVIQQVTRTRQGFQQVSKKCNAPINFQVHGDEPLALMFQEYDRAAYFENELYHIRGLHNCYYRVKGAIVHHGNQAGYGHYVHLNRTGDGTYIYRSDTHVQIMTTEEAKKELEGAVLLELELIEKAPFRRVAPPVAAPAPKQEAKPAEPAVKPATEPKAVKSEDKAIAKQNKKAKSDKKAVVAVAAQAQQTKKTRFRKGLVKTGVSG